MAIVDEYLWRLLARHGLLDAQQNEITGYDRRRHAFDPLWKQLVESQLNSPSELAATLYLWACEAERFKYAYS